jgi:2,4-dienoyl-CoA reductase-like NADH-dependent reductase (Old Yellow Enzyme family)/thioredoxin reductase
MALKNLFKPIKLGKLEVRNRVVFAPIGIGAYNDDETVNENYFPFITERAKETGLIITQGTRPSLKGGVKLIGCYDDRFIPSLKKFAGSAHKNGAKIFLQLVVVGGNDPLGGYAPSVVDIPLYRDQWGRGGANRPKELRNHQIKELVEEFAQAARRAQEAGFDGVEVHGAYGYLISAFICPATNRRTDEYGGSFENRLRFPVEIIRRIKSVCGDDFPIGFKFNSHQEIEPEGIDEELGVKNAQRIASEGVVYLHEVTMGEDVMYMQLAKYPSMPTMYQPRNTTVSLAENLKKHIDGVPIIAAGGITKPEEADEIIGENKADMVAVGRALLADPHWTYKAMKGERITPCIKCLVCHNEVVKKGNFAGCTVNPYLVRELEEPLVKAERSLKVMVAGGGPAGVTAAVTASKRGHDVCLYEAQREIGGQLIPGSAPLFKYEFQDLLKYFRDELDDSNVRVEIGKEVTAREVKDEAPDVLIIATGGYSIIPDIPGIDMEHVLPATRCLKEPEFVKGNRVVVIGGGDVGCETAVFLKRRKKEVTIVEKLPTLMEKEDMKYHTLVMEEMLEEEGIVSYTSSEVTDIKEGTLKIKTGDGKTIDLPADTVVVAIGIEKDPAYVENLKEACPVSHVIGDAGVPQTLREAVFDGDKIARSI